MGAIFSFAVAPSPPVAPPPEKRHHPSDGRDAFTNTAGSAAVVTSVLEFTGWDAILALEALSWGCRRSVRDAPISFRVATDAPMTRELRRMVILANRGALLGARRAGSLVPDQRVIAMIWNRCKGAEQIPGDMTYHAGYALVPTPRKPAALVRAEAGVDVARSVAARAAVERQHAALVNSGVVRFNISSPVGDAVAACGLRALKSDRIGSMGDPDNDKPADPALAELLVGALGPLAERAPLLDATRRKFHAYTVGGYVKMRTLDAALARSAAAASSVDLSTLRRLVARFAWRTYLEKRGKDDASGYDIGGPDQRKSYVDEQQFKVLCREVAAPRADEIWAEATAGLLSPFGLQHVSPEDGETEWRETGDVRVGDIAALELDSALMLACSALAALEQCDGDPVAIFSADFDARSHVFSQGYECGNRLYISLGILDALALPREGERDGEAGAKRVEAAIASLLTPDRLPALHEGETVAVLQNLHDGGPSDGRWNDSTFVKIKGDGVAIISNVGVEREHMISGIQRINASREAPAAARLLCEAVAAGRNEIVVRLLRGMEYASIYAVQLDLDEHATALDRAIDNGNSVAAALLAAQHGKNFLPHACNAVRKHLHLKKTVSLRLQGELLRALGIYDVDTVDFQNPMATRFATSKYDPSNESAEVASLAAAGDLVGVRRAFAASVARVRRASRLEAFVEGALKWIPQRLEELFYEKIDYLLESRFRASLALGRDVRTALWHGAAAGRAEIVAEALLPKPELLEHDFDLGTVTYMAFRTCVLQGHAGLHRGVS